MYCTYFGFTKEPFGPGFDPEFLYRSKQWKSVFAGLASELRSNCKILLLLGKSGVGKNYLMQILEEQLKDHTTFFQQAVDTFNPQDWLDKFSSEKTYFSNSKTAAESGSPARTGEKRPDQYRSALVIKDAHLLSDQLLKQVGRIANSAAGKKLSLQVILTGRPELKKKFNSVFTGSNGPDGSNCFELNALEEQDCAGYIQRRLEVVGGPNSELFPENTLLAVHQYSQGLPGTINILCRAALWSASSTGNKIIRPDLIRKIAETKFQGKPGQIEDKNSAPVQASKSRSNWNREQEKMIEAALNTNTFLNILDNKATAFATVGLVAFIGVYLLVINTNNQTASTSPVELSGVIESANPPEFHPMKSAYRPRPAPAEPPTPQAPAIEPADDDFASLAAAAESEIPSIPNEPVQLPRTIENRQPVEPAKSPDVKPDRGRAVARDSVREYIKHQEARGANKDLDRIFQKAQKMSQENRHSDAYLLYFYAARLGHGDSAFRLGQINDPATYQPTLNVMDSPDAVQAYKWYQKAALAGHSGANLALNRLRGDIQKRASAGDIMAQRWLLQWD